MTEQVDLQPTEEVLARYPGDARHLISVLQDIQLAYRYQYCDDYPLHEVLVGALRMAAHATAPKTRATRARAGSVAPKRKGK